MRARLFIATISALTLLPLAAAPASAAPPGNDEPAGAVGLKLGDRVVQNTSQATTNAQDAALNEECGAPATNASVWYKYTSAVSRRVVLDTTTSGYSAGMLVFRGAPTASSLVACGPGLVGLSVAAGRTYNIMVISDTDVNGGRLVLSVKKAPPPPRAHVTIARRGQALRGGAARIHGTYTCRHGDFTELFGTLFQRAGRLKISAEFYKQIRCNGRPHNWRARLVSPIATYARGGALAKVTINACGIFQCRHDRARRRVHLVSAGGRSGHRSAPVSTRRIEHARPLVERQGHWPGS
jgi:hypothetical protein